MLLSTAHEQRIDNTEPSLKPLETCNYLTSLICVLLPLLPLVL